MVWGILSMGHQKQDTVGQLNVKSIIMYIYFPLFS